MPKWQFWKKDVERTIGQPVPAPPVVASRARGFTPPPPRSSTGMSSGPAEVDPAIARMVKRHESLAEQLEQAELAASADNPWAERVAVVDQAIAGVDKELQQPAAQVQREPLDLPSTPIEIKSVLPEAPSQVHLRIGEFQFDYEEEIDWAERGTTVVRGELRLVRDDFANLLPHLNLNADDAAKLQLSLFELATEIRDSALEDTSMNSSVLLNELLAPCPVCGDVRLWNGVCLNCEARNAKLAQLEEERQRLFEERDGILKDRESTVERLPVLRKRFAESAEALERTRSTKSGG